MRFLLIVLLCSVCFIAAAQEDNVRKAKENWLQAKSFSNRRMYDVAISTLQSSIRLDPENIIYPLEIAFVYYTWKNYRKAISKLEELRFHKQVNASVYQLLARSYFMDAQEDKGVKALETGLNLFPKSALLCTEAGEYYLAKQDTTMALRCFERSMLVEKNYLPGYSNAAMLYGFRKNYGACMAAAEIAMNLDRDGTHRRQLSTLIFFSSINLFNTGFGQSAPRDAALNNIAAHRNLSALDTICQYLLTVPAIETFYATDTAWGKRIMFSRNSIQKAGHAEAYQYWLLQAGDPDGFAKWRDDNPEKWQQFVAWQRRRRLMYQ